ncbi:hypothetical protein B932_0442 [Gluconobacter oxydans H24]|nr:hypothetical protein B932_0442 [Gluconobacter oxydans H24]
MFYICISPNRKQDIFLGKTAISGRKLVMPEAGIKKATSGDVATFIKIFQNTDEIRTSPCLESYSLLGKLFRLFGNNDYWPPMFLEIYLQNTPPTRKTMLPLQKTGGQFLSGSSSFSSLFLFFPNDRP